MEETAKDRGGAVHGFTVMFKEQQGSQHNQERESDGETM